MHYFFTAWLLGSVSQSKIFLIDLYKKLYYIFYQRKQLCVEWTYLGKILGKFFDRFPRKLIFQSYINALELCHFPIDAKQRLHIRNKHTSFYRFIKKTDRIKKKKFFRIPEGDHRHEKIHFFWNMKLCYEKSSTLIGFFIWKKTFIFFPILEGF